MTTDKMSIEVLEDGTIKVVTSSVSQPNHANAEAFVSEMGRLAGGSTTRVRRPDTQHEHTHSSSDHAHQH